jgi:hypothetical protein
MCVRKKPSLTLFPKEQFGKACFYVEAWNIRVSPWEFKSFTLRKTLVVAKNMPNKIPIPLDSL